MALGEAVHPWASPNLASFFKRIMWFYNDSTKVLLDAGH
jgi:hypothetical protein